MKQIHDLFNYIDGVLYWSISPRIGINIGDAAGYMWNGKYAIIMYKGKTYQRNRLIWEMFNGPIPEGMEVDHIDDDPTNDKIENLQLLTKSKNLSKIAISANKNKLNSSGVKGVSWHKKRNKWQVQHAHKFYGYFDSMLDAVAERLRIERTLKYYCKLKPSQE